ncbi:MAG: hypothetical protein JXJ17_00445 [Anaerolineae bacterium]|nr:hypothetical protein [Anaerolineae bacterium]
MTLRRSFAVLLIALLITGCLPVDAPLPVGPVEDWPPADPAAELIPAPVEVDLPPLARNAVVGRVVMGTPGADLPAGLSVRLRGRTRDESGQPVDFLVVDVPVDAGGAFRFDGAAFDRSGITYTAEMTLDGLTFSEGRGIDPRIPSVAIPLVIYATTADSDVITVEMELTLIDQPGALAVEQRIAYSNLSDRAYATRDPVRGGQRGSVTISLPADAYGVAFAGGQIGGRFVETGPATYVDTALVPPGERVHTIEVSYFLPYDGPRELSLPLTYTVESLAVHAPEAYPLRAGGLFDAGYEVIGGDLILHYVGVDLDAGEPLLIEIGPVEAGESNVLRVALITIGGVIAISVVVWLIGRIRRRGGRWTASQRRLIREIAALDDAHAAGEIGETDYRARRADLKATLVEERER